MAIHLIPFIAIGALKLGVTVAKSDVIVEVARNFTEKAHSIYPNAITRKALDILDHDDTKHTGFILNDGVAFVDIKNKIEGLGEMSLVMEDGVTATTVTTKDGIERQVDFVIIAREDVKERVINALLVDCKEFINFTPKQPVTALGQLARSVSDKLPTELQNRLPSFLRRSGQ
jgi:hypothetical protein